MPADCIKFLPLSLFKDFIFKFDLNEYAMFTGGYWYKDFDDLNKPASELSQQLRTWKIQDFYIEADV